MTPRGTVVVGCGNPVRGDDGVGVQVVARLRHADLPADVQLVDLGTSAFDVLDLLRHCDRMVLVDASTTGAPPGTIHRLPIEALDPEPAPTELSLHAVRWDHILGLAWRMLGDRLTARVEVVLVEAASVDFSEHLTPEVEAAATRVADLLVAELGGAGPV